MAEQGNRWSWDVAGFEPWKSPSPEQNDQKPTAPLARRNSTTSSVPPHSVASKVEGLREKVKLARIDYLQLRQEASELQEYSNAKLDRVTRYLGVLAEKTHKLDQVALETEARMSSVIKEKKKLFNDLLTSKGNIRVFCRTRPLFEDEGSSVVEFPDDYTIRVNTGDESLSNSKKEFEFDRVYGPHVGQGNMVLFYVTICLGGGGSD
ncbi:hypothetical protein JHK85_003309 [Glycine max]|nr:hypothetical protein JHK85_003309 [Glycine max]